MLEVSNCSPEMAVPMTVKMPEPMTAPMPSAVSDQGPSVFFSACSGCSESEISLSMDLQASSWLGSAVLLVGRMREPQGEVYMMTRVLTRAECASVESGLEGMRKRREACGAGEDAGPCATYFRTPLALGLAARKLLDLLLVFAARAGARSLGSGLLTGGALHLFAFDFIFNLLGISHGKNLFHSGATKCPICRGMRPLW